MRASSLFTGALGVKAHGRAIDSVADNIANVSTHGFKATRALFSTLMSRQLAGLGTMTDLAGYSEGNQVGLGVTATAMNVMTAGAHEQTELNTDLAIDGQGFFIVKASAVYTSAFGTVTSGQEGSRTDSPNYYTRAGQFKVDRNGYIVNQQNYVLQGFLADADGNVVKGEIQDLRIPSDALVNRATSKVQLGMNLDASDTTVHADAIEIIPGDASTYNYSTPTVLYDNDGNSHNIMMYYQRVEPMSSRAWKVAMYEKNGSNYTAIENGQFRLNFDEFGQLSLVNNPTADSFQSAYGISASQLISTTMGQSLSFSGANGVEQYLTPAKLTFYAGLAGGETVTIGSQTYTLGAHGTAGEAAAELISLINSNTVNAGCYAIDNGSGKITLQPTTASPLEVSSSTSGIAVSAGVNTSTVGAAINNGVNSGGTLLLSSLAAAGQTINLGAQSYTVPSGATVAEIAASLADIINNAGYYSASAQGDGLYISAKEAGKAGNVSFSASDNSNIILSGSSLVGGMDGSALSQVYAKVVSDSSGKQTLSLTRAGAGAGATITGLSSTFTATAAAAPLTFSQTGQAGDTLNITNGQVPVQFAFSPGSTQQVIFDFTPQGGGSVTTQQGNFYSLTLLDQDGFPAGEVESLSFDGNGNVWVGYTNDQYSLVGTVALANFNSPWELDRYGDNLWLGTPAAGEAKIGLPNSNDEYSLGSIEAGALEKSNVDLAQEMVNMINYQRAYQFNSKSITTTDEMLKEAINIKR